MATILGSIQQGVAGAQAGDHLAGFAAGPFGRGPEGILRPAVGIEELPHRRRHRLPQGGQVVAAWPKRA